jgi:predicted metal-dependent enzyme (double-stranded beta helix superfamily)
MWATIGIYAGREDNAFYRRATDDRSTLVESGGKQLGVGDVVTLGDDRVSGDLFTDSYTTATFDTKPKSVAERAPWLRLP